MDHPDFISCSLIEHSIGLKRVKVRGCGHHVAVTYNGVALTVNEAGKEHRCYNRKIPLKGLVGGGGGWGVLTTLSKYHQRITQRVVYARTFFEKQLDPSNEVRTCTRTSKEIYSHQVSIFRGGGGCPASPPSSGSANDRSCTLYFVDGHYDGNMSIVRIY